MCEIYILISSVVNSINKRFPKLKRKKKKITIVKIHTRRLAQDDRCCVNLSSNQPSSVLKDVQRCTWLALVVDRERTGVISGFAPATLTRTLLSYVLIGLSSHLLPSTVACLTRPCSPSALLRGAFPFTVCLIEYPTSGKSVEPPVKGVGQPLAVCLARLLPFGFPTLDSTSSRPPVIRVQCDFLPIRIESRKK